MINGSNDYMDRTPLKVSHQPTKFGGHRQGGNGNSLEF